MLVDIQTPCARCRVEISGMAPYCRNCGYAQPAHEAEAAAARAAAEPSARAALLPTRPSPAALISLLVVVASILAATTPILVVRSVFFGPADSVHDYFEALADRDAGAAWRYVYAEGSGQAGPLASLSGPDYTPPDQFRLLSVDTDGDRATAQVSYQISGTEYREEFRLRRLGGPEHTFQRWDIENALRALPVSAVGLSSVTVAGTPVYPGQSGQIMVFPGRYTVRAPETPLADAEPVTVSTGGQQGATLTPRLRATAQEAVEKQLKEYLDGCARQEVAEPEGCPFQYSGFYEITSIKWRIVEYPRMQYQLTPEGLAFAQTAANGTVEGTARTMSTFEPTDVVRLALVVSGQITTNGTDVVFTVTQ
ncbi:hypothetical protein GCM10022251_56850 [Phytohabitans flavus]